MRSLAALLMAFAGMSAGVGYAQNWIVFVPIERDFRVLFPNPPIRSTVADGSVAFKSSIEDFDFIVYRVPPGTGRITNARAEIQRRLFARLGEDASVRYVRDEDEDGDWERHVFRVKGGISVHRLVEHRGRYYELQVQATLEKRARVRHTARDFFNSFQVTGLPVPSIGMTLGQKVEAWCQGRTDAFTRAFCEYSICLQPGYEKYPHCKALPGR